MMVKHPFKRFVGAPAMDASVAIGTPTIETSEISLVARFARANSENEVRYDERTQ